MLLISRISRLFRADLHAVLDRIEEPEALLRQAIREMEELLAQDEQRSRLLQEEQRQLTSRQNKLEHELEQIKEKLAVCLQSNKEDLARKLIRRQELKQITIFLRQDSPIMSLKQMTNHAVATMETPRVVSVERFPSTCCWNVRPAPVFIGTGNDFYRPWSFSIFKVFSSVSPMLEGFPLTPNYYYC